MTLMQYLLEYTLENVCRGNRSECARRMGMEYAELRRVRKRMSEGSVSSRATEALLEMYWREGLSVDEVLRQYTRSQFGEDLEAVEQVCSELVKELRESLQDQGRNTHRSAHLMKTAYQFVGQVQRCFCDELCQRSRYQDTPCPAKRLMDFLSWLEQERKTLTARDESAREETMEVVEEETCLG